MGEIEYLNLINEVICNGELSQDRNGNEIKSILDARLEMDLSQDRIPLLTTRKISWSQIVEELVWIVRGSTNLDELKEKNIHSFNIQGSRQFLEKIGQGQREEGDLGPITGFQWRHFGADYVDMKTDYKGKGADQLSDLLNRIKPGDRRLLLRASNTIDSSRMACQPDHRLIQFLVYPNDKLVCIVYSNLSDLALEVPVVIARYALLTHFIARLTNLKPLQLNLIMAEAYIYPDHLEALKEQIKRTPGHFPTIKFKRDISSIEDFKSEDVELLNYKPQDAIQLKVLV